MSILFSLVGPAGEFIHWIVILIVVAAALGIGLVVLRASGIGVPPWFGQLAWIVVLAVAAILALRFIMYMT